jgi:hypothetical protein
MAKIKSTITGGGSGVNHSKAYKATRRDEVCAGGAGNATVHVNSNSHPLDTMIERGSLREVDEYDYATGKMRKRPLDVLSNARESMARLKTYPVTTARQYEEDSKPRYPTIGYGPYAGPMQPRGRRK